MKHRTTITVSNHGAKPYYVTPEGLEELQQLLAELRRTQDRTIAEKRELASQSSSGNTLEESANALYFNQASAIERQISLLQHILGTAKVISEPASSDHVQLGSRVTVEIDGDRRTYHIVGSLEVDPTGGKISNESPLGQALLGKKVDECFQLALATKQLTATVRAIA